jgi:SAM-dependent methyltransferase
MHHSSMQSMQKFADDYLDKNKPLRILNVGSRDVDGCNMTYRSMFESENWKHDGLDLVAGQGVDIVATELYHYPIETGTYDVVISGQVLEHVLDMYQWIREVARCVKPGGYVCIIAPWRWDYHPHPVDCWRIMRDGMRFLLNTIADLDVLEVYEYVDDCVGVARKREATVIPKGVTLEINVVDRMSKKETM